MLAGMSTTASQRPTPEAPIEAIQPGGGFCFQLETSWGKWRRAWLRRFFPAYVQRMKGLRQGDCPDCAHDIIDSRDLKLVRNVCGFWFRPEDDPYAWRDRLGLARAGFAEILLSSLVLLPLLLGCAILALVHHPLWVVCVALLLPLYGFLLAFFRDPHRVIPSEPEALVSPADGVITHLEELDEPDLGRVFRVSIFLSVFNVHVNRVPRSGTVKRIAYYPGEFLDARDADCPVRNEQLWVDLTDESLGGTIRIKQIAGAIARRIVCWLRLHEQVKRGERFGMIKFGSRTEVLLPADLVAEVTVRVGQAVRGGRDILLRLRGEDRC